VRRLVFTPPFFRAFRRSLFVIVVNLRLIHRTGTIGLNSHLTTADTCAQLGRE
jgi:hypothetical protein